MDELAKLIQEKTGIPEAQAKTAAETALNFIKERLPEPIASQVDGFLGGGAGGAGGSNPLGDLGNLGGLGG
jgi:hypothetical protein